MQVVKRSNDYHETIRFSAWLLAGLVHLFIQSYMSQILSDHSVRIHYYM